MNLLNFVGMGTVTATKDTDTKEILVYIPSLFPAADGRTVADAQTVERKSVNASGEEVKSNLLHSNSVPAVWRSMGDTARLTPPDVREGSQVAIYQVSGQNRYYWTNFGVNNNTYRLETVLYGWNANPTLGEDADFDITNYYVMKVDTRTGLMALRTSQANGEKSSFDIQINAMEGVFSLGATNKSFFVINDTDHSLTYTNEEGTVFNISKKDVNVYAKDKVNVFAENTLNIKTKVLNVQAQEANVDIGVTRWKGKFEHTGDMNQTGDLTQTGNIDSTGTIHADVDVTTNDVSVNEHTHGGIYRGGSRTDPANA